jgi:phosphoribosyl-ATP pyrophosphohydrolase
MTMTGFSLTDLEAIVARRAEASTDESWTAKLVAAGQPKAAKKLGEEAVEAVMAAVTGDRENLVYEAADLLYHLMVVLKIAGIPLETIMQELERRTGQSGLSEKASRKDP